jgi:hypothetical protein
MSAASLIFRLISTSRDEFEKVYIEAESRKELVVSTIGFSGVELG